MIFVAYFKTLPWSLGSDKEIPFHAESRDEAFANAMRFASRKNGWKLVDVSEEPIQESEIKDD